MHADTMKIVYCEVAQRGYVPRMAFQETLALGIVAITATVFLWNCLRPRRFSFVRDTHCGCSTRSPEMVRQSIVFHARKGERPQVMLKLR
jgi:hypothetical protein